MLKAISNVCVSLRYSLLWSFKSLWSYFNFEQQNGSRAHENEGFDPNLEQRWKIFEFSLWNFMTYKCNTIEKCKKKNNVCLKGEGLVNSEPHNHDLLQTCSFHEVLRVTKLCSSTKILFLTFHNHSKKWAFQKSKIWFNDF